jgi:hypothetical protein
MAYDEFHREPIVDFYAGKATDGAGRRLREIWGWDFERLEHTHDYIQWLFPLAERSRFNPDAPVLDAEQIAAFRADDTLRGPLLASLDVMLRFYGLARSGMTVTRSGDWPLRSRNWLTPGNHNHLRLTRILKSLSILGLGEFARGLLAALESIYREHPGVISATTLEFWQRAVAEE